MTNNVPDAASVLALYGFILLVLTAAVIVAWLIWIAWVGKPPERDDTGDTGDGWVTVATWLEDADGTPRPATPDAVADFWRRWDEETP